jgi:Skp family chaperone for outer membrane proteins
MAVVRIVDACNFVRPGDNECVTFVSLFPMEAIIVKIEVRYLGALIIGGFACWGVAQSVGQTEGGGGSPAVSPTTPAAPAANVVPGQKVAVIDLFRVFNECAQIQYLNEEIKKKTEEYSKEATERRKRIEDRQQALNAFQPGTKDFEDRRRDLIRSNIEANVWLKVSEQEIEQDRFMWTVKIYRQACDLAGAIAKERGIDVVIQRSEFKPDDLEQTIQALRRLIQEREVVYNAAEMDITDLVIRRMDKDYRATQGKPKV